MCGRWPIHNVQREMREIYEERRKPRTHQITRYTCVAEWITPAQIIVLFTHNVQKEILSQHWQHTYLFVHQSPQRIEGRKSVDFAQVYWSVAEFITWSASDNHMICAGLLLHTCISSWTYRVPPENYKHRASNYPLHVSGKCSLDDLTSPQKWHFRKVHTKRQTS